MVWEREVRGVVWEREVKWSGVSVRVRRFVCVRSRVCVCVCVRERERERERERDSTKTIIVPSLKTAEPVTQKRRL